MDLIELTDILKKHKVKYGTFGPDEEGKWACGIYLNEDDLEEKINADKATLLCISACVFNTEKRSLKSMKDMVKNLKKLDINFRGDIKNN